MKLQYTVLYMMALPVIYAWPLKKCPDLPKYSEINISMNQLKGEWQLTASKPEFSEKCKNITITVSPNEDNLHEEYYSQVMYFWHHRSSKDYIIEKKLKSSVLELKNKAWYSFETEKMTLIGVDYASYALFYSCSGGFFKISETYELWTRDKLNNTTNLPQTIADTLTKFKVKPEDLSFKTEKDCSY